MKSNGKASTVNNEQWKQLSKRNNTARLQYKGKDNMGL